MSEGVKSKPAKPKKRRYDSSRRRDQAAATRRAILDAAQRLFEEGGYGGTSMADVAREAGVALKTVYLAFDTKSGLLRAVWHRALRGDEQDAPVGERSWFREVIEEPDPTRQLQLNVRNGLAVKQRAAATMEAIRAAAASEPDIAELWGRIRSDFRANQGAIVASLAGKDALRPELTVEEAADVLYALQHPGLYWLLVDERGWSPERYAEWLADTMCERLLVSRTSSEAGPRRRPRRSSPGAAGRAPSARRAPG
jgi:AcrR family transcriptional regulator